jgi:hypothetical protein
MQGREDLAEAVEAEFVSVAVAAELHIPWAARRISAAAAECAWAEAAAGCTSAELPVSAVGRRSAPCAPAVDRVLAAFASAAHLASLAGRRYPTLRRVPRFAVSARLRLAAVRAGPPAVLQR